MLSVVEMLLSFDFTLSKKYFIVPANIAWPSSFIARFVLVATVAHVKRGISVFVVTLTSFKLVSQNAVSKSIRGMP